MLKKEVNTIFAYLCMSKVIPISVLKLVLLLEIHH
jgi:hypothetical protein